MKDKPVCFSAAATLAFSLLSVSALASGCVVGSNQSSSSSSSQSQTSSSKSSSKKSSSKSSSKKSSSSSSSSSSSTEPTPIVKGTIYFNANGGTGTMSPQEIEVGETAALSSNSFERAYYDFNGWATSPTGSVVYADGANFAMEAEDDYSLYAQWSPTEYTITYSLDGGINGVGNAATYTVEDSFTFATPTKAGHSFDGWYADEEYTTQKTGISVGEHGNVTVYAKWTINQNTLAFNGNGATGGSMSVIQVNEGVPTAIPQNTFERSGYAFKGWAIEENGNVVYANGG